VATKAHTIINIKDKSQSAAIFGLVMQLETIFLIWGVTALSYLSLASFAGPWMLLNCWSSLSFIIWSCPVPFLPFSYGNPLAIVNYCYSCFTFPSIFRLRPIAFRKEPRQFDSVFCLNSPVFALLISLALVEFHFPMHFWILSGLFYW
jgi:hypothetical protein